MSAEQQDGERERVAHALTRIEYTVRAMRIALATPTPIGLEGPQALLTTAGEVMAHAAAADAYSRARTTPS